MCFLQLWCVDLLGPPKKLLNHKAFEMWFDLKAIPEWKRRKGRREGRHTRTGKLNWCLLSLSESLSVSVSTDALFLLEPWLLSCPDKLSSLSLSSSSELLPVTTAGDDDCDEAEEWSDNKQEAANTLTWKWWYRMSKYLLTQPSPCLGLNYYTLPFDDKDSCFCRAEFRVSSTTTVRETWRKFNIPLCTVNIWMPTHRDIYESKLLTWT